MLPVDVRAAAPSCSGGDISWLGYFPVLTAARAVWLQERSDYSGVSCDGSCPTCIWLLATLGSDTDFLLG